MAHDMFPMMVKHLPFEDGKTAFSPSDMDSSWHTHPQEGRLAVDVIENDRELVILSTIAGASEHDFDISVHEDLLTIRGVREYPLKHAQEGTVLHQECFWGSFSRTIVLPVEVKSAAAHAEYRYGVLTIRIPKEHTDRRIPIIVVDE